MEWKQIQPDWCPHKECLFRRRVMDDMCVGCLPKPEPHDGDFNDSRLCLNGVADNGGVFDLQINSSDVSWFRWVFNALYPINPESLDCAKEEDDDGSGFCRGCGVTIGEPHHTNCQR